jgi:pimeloyl-ACP methyl ester carboxylesterase
MRDPSGTATTHEALLETIRHFRPQAPSPVAARLDTAVALDDGTGQPWTVRIRKGRLSLRRGLLRRVETTIVSDPLTLIGVIRGTRCGVEAFLRGRLRVRGNLSLALKLDGLFDRGTGDARRPRPGRAMAAGIDTFYLEAGRGPTVILLHGLGATNSSMLTTLWDLAQDHHVIAPDLPGFGDSSKPMRPYHPAFFARWLDDFMEELGIDRAHLIGNSMGGRISIEAALRYPHRVDRMVLLAPSMAFRRFRQAVPLVRWLPAETAVLPLRAPRFQVHQTLRLLFAHPSRVRETWYEAAVDEFTRTFRSPRGRVAFFSAARQIYLEQPFGPRGFWRRVRRLERPALFVWGDRDWLVPARFARHVQASVPQAECIVLDDCGHVPQFELPEITNQLARNFLGRERLADRAVPSAR